MLKDVVSKGLSACVTLIPPEAGRSVIEACPTMSFRRGYQFDCQFRLLARSIISYLHPTSLKLYP
jgi:hypothetical protein